MKIRNLVFSIGRNFGSIDRNGKEIYLGVFACFDQSKGTLDQSKLIYLNFLVTALKD